MAGNYTFGDSDLAAQRMALVADVFAEPSRRLLADAVPAGSSDLALDLGCGPGYTTRLVAETCRPRRTIGLDGSPRYVETARSLTTDPSVEFAVHDVTSTPFPEGPADLIFVRLLLAHLPDPLGLVDRWRGELAPDGRLVVDEIEAMETPTGVLRDYEKLVVALVAAEGGMMYAGPLLAPLGGDCVELDVDAGVAARMYGMNLHVWRDDAERRGLATKTELDRLAGGLAALQHHLPPDPTRRPPRPRGPWVPSPPVHWVLRQLVLNRRDRAVRG